MTWLLKLWVATSTYFNVRLPNSQELFKTMTYPNTILAVRINANVFGKRNWLTILEIFRSMQEHY
jgi:hypothetical protein